MTKYEYEVTELQHGIYTIKVGALGLCVAIALYLPLVVFYEGISERDSLIKTILFLVVGLVSLVHFLKDLYQIYFKKGRWLFRLDKKGIYLLTPEEERLYWMRRGRYIKVLMLIQSHIIGWLKDMASVPG